MNYYEKEIQRIIPGMTCSCKTCKNLDTGDYKIKISGPKTDTKWMNITYNELMKIKRLMSKKE